MKILLFVLLAIVAASAQQTFCVNTTTSNLNLRSGPCGTFSVVASMPSGSVVTTVNSTEWFCSPYYWRRIQYKTYVGYAATAFLGVCPPPSDLDFLTGRYNPSDYNTTFVSFQNGSLGVPSQTPDRVHFMRIEAFNALQALYTEFRAEYPSVPFWVQSSLRTYGDQKSIWEGKWNGDYSSITNLTERGLAVLTFSAIPGASRHHWGTDIDINELYNSYYESGYGLIIKNWMDANAARFGFCQPYTAGRVGGHSEERWHWSYLPIAVNLRNAWLSNQTAILNSLNQTFLGSEYVLNLAPSYIYDINPNCFAYSPAPSRTPTPSVTPTASVTPSSTATPSSVPSSSPTPTASGSATPSG